MTSDRVPLWDIFNTGPETTRVTQSVSPYSQGYFTNTCCRQSKHKSQTDYASLPKHISSDEVIKFLEERKAKKEMEEKEN